MRGTPTRSSPRRWTSSKTTSPGWCSTPPWRFSDAGQATGSGQPALERGDLDPPPARAQGPKARLRLGHRGRSRAGSANRQGLRLGPRRRGPVDWLHGSPRERARLHPQLAPAASGSARHARARLPARPVDGARRAHPGAPAAGGRRTRAVKAPIEHTSPAPSAAVLEPFAHGGRALMLGHVHPDADVLGTLLALGLALEAQSWSVVYGGPHPAPSLLGFLPGVERYRTLDRLDGRYDIVVLTDCPNPQRTEGLIDQARAAGKLVVNIDHHPDNRRYGDVNWIDVTAAATGEMVYELLTALRVSVTPAMATNLFTAIHTDTGSFRYSNVTARTFTIAAALVAAGARPELVSESLYERRAPDALRWLGEALARVEVSADGQVGWLALPARAVPERIVESEELVNYPRSVASVRVACLLRELDGTVKVRLRGKGDVDVQKIAAQFGGGGHVNAAGCTVSGPLPEATRRVLDAVRRAVDDEAAS